MSVGRVVFVGGGTGDPRLVTLRGAEVLAEADVVLAPPDLDLRELCKDGAEWVTLARGQASAEIAERAGLGQTVARVVFGDALFFGADDEALAAVRAGLDVEIVPGVTLAVAAGAYAGLALTRAADASPSVALVRAPERDGADDARAWEKLATATDAIAITTRGAAVLEIARALTHAGRPANSPAAFACGLSTPAQSVVYGALDAIGADAAAMGEGLFVVGDGVLLRGALAWLERRPLFGFRVLVTRTREQSRGTADLLRARGAEPVVVPAIEIHPPRAPEKLSEAIERLPGDSAIPPAQCVVFTSANGVARTWREIARKEKDARVFGGAKIAAIGPGTAQALEAHGLRADIVAKEHKQEGLADEILRALAVGEKGRVVLFRAEAARDALPTALRDAGFDVEIVAAYETRPPDRSRAEALARELEAGALDAVTFTSSSTVDNVCDMLGPRAAELLGKAVVASIGPITSKNCLARGVRVDVTATNFTVLGLIDALEGHVSSIDKGASRRRSSK